MSYLGNSPGVASQRLVSSFTATSGQTTFTPLSGYTLGYVDVFLNGIKLVNGDDYTAGNGTTVVLATGAAVGDSLEVVSYTPRGLSDGYTKTEADARYLQLTTSNVSFNNLTLAGELRGPSTLIIDPAAVGDDTGTVRVRGNLQVDGTTTTVNSTTLEVADLNITLAKNAANSAAADGAGITVAGANATLTYVSASDTWNVNKNILITPGTANGVMYLNASKVATTGSALTFDGNNLILGGSSGRRLWFVANGTSDTHYVKYDSTIIDGLAINGYSGLSFSTGSTTNSTWAEQMRLTTTGLRIGLGGSSPTAKLHVTGTSGGGYQTSNKIILQRTDATLPTGSIEFQGSGGHTNPYWNILTDADVGNDFGVSYNGSKFLQILSNGNVGIGTTSPDAGAKLTVAGGILTTSNFSATTGSTAGIDYLSGNLRFFAIGTSGSTKGGYQWIAKGADNSQVTSMTLDASGNLGVSTTTTAVSGGDYKNIVLGGVTTNAGGYYITQNSDGSVRGQLGVDTSVIYIGSRTNHPVAFTINNAERARITSSGDLLPGSDNTQNLGSTSKRWANFYTADLHLSNQGKQNDVDSTWGDWTIQEGEDNLYVINNRTGKKFKIKLEEV